jgi:hypothetical protein
LFVVKALIRRRSEPTGRPATNHYTLARLQTCDVRRTIVEFYTTRRAGRNPPVDILVSYTIGQQIQHRISNAQPHYIGGVRIIVIIIVIRQTSHMPSLLRTNTIINGGCVRYFVRVRRWGRPDPQSTLFKGPCI